MKSLAYGCHEEGIRSRFVPNNNGLLIHILEAGPVSDKAPAVLLLHGFPELAYSWRHIMRTLAEQGFHVLAPDQRGYGRTEGWDPRFEADLSEYSALNLVHDMLGMLDHLNVSHLRAVIGHDFGAMVAGWFALLRPDMCDMAMVLSAPFTGPPRRPAVDVDQALEDLAGLERPRKHYHWYYATARANHDMSLPPQGLGPFLRAYYHHKSADWVQNKPHPLECWTAQELEKLPTYYVMDLHETMPETVAWEMPTEDEIKRQTWFDESVLQVYVGEYQRNGFQGGLHWYGARIRGSARNDLQVFFGQKITIPFTFLAGASDWGYQQIPGGLEAMESLCTKFRGVKLIEGAGHWVQQEKPYEVGQHILKMLADYH